MKKVLTLVLAMCLVLAAIPATAEGEVTGTWYLISMGMTAGTAELKEDGTCSMTVEADEEVNNAEGTWTMEGDVVTLTIQEKSLALTYDGTELVLGAEALAMLGGDSFSGIAQTGVDLSALKDFIRFSREPGKVTLAEYTAFDKEGTLPEGKTQEEMEAIRLEMQMTALGMFGALFGVDGGEGLSLDLGAGDTASAETPELTVVEENFYVRESYFGKEAVYIAKVQNNTEAAFWISDGSLTLKDADGNELAKKEYMGTSGSRYLEPGEVSYVSFVMDVEEGKEPAAFEPEIQTSANGYGQDKAVEVANVELRTKEGFSGNDYYTAASVTNAGEEPLARINVVVVTRDSEGRMIDIGDSSLGMNELGAGSTIILIDDIPSAVIDYCEANNLTLGEMETCAWVDLSGY